MNSNLKMRNKAIKNLIIPVVITSLVFASSGLSNLVIPSASAYHWSGLSSEQDCLDLVKSQFKEGQLGIGDEGQDSNARHFAFLQLACKKYQVIEPEIVPHSKTK